MTPAKEYSSASSTMAKYKKNPEAAVVGGTAFGFADQKR